MAEGGNDVGGGDKGDRGNRGEREGPEREPGFFKGMGMLASMGIAMVVSTFFGLIIGVYLDKWLGTHPWLTLLFLFFGIAAGFKNIFHLVRKYGDGEF